MPGDWFLALAAARGDPERVVELLIERYGAPLYRYFRNQGLQDADALDLVQQTFLSAYTAWGRFELRSEDALRGWLWTIARRVISARVRHDRAARRDRRHIAEGVELDSLAQSTTPASDPDTLVQAMAQLTLDQREVLRRHLEGDTPDEIARATGRSHNAVYLLMKRIRDKLEPDNLGEAIHE